LSADFPFNNPVRGGSEKMKDNYASKSSRLSRYVFLLPVLPVLINFLHSVNLFNEFIFTWPVLWLYLIYTSIALALYFLLKIIFRFTVRQAAVLSSLIMLFFTLGGSIEGYLIRQKNFSFLGKWIVLFAIVSILLGGLAVYYKKRNPPVIVISQYLASLFAIIILYESVKFVRALYMGRTLFAVVRQMTKPVLDERKIIIQEKPDIHYIIFDSYTNSRALKKYWNFDNPVYPYLSDRGFYTVDSAVSNYNMTSFSLGSIFNLQYLTAAGYYLERNVDNWYLGLGVYKDNQLFRFLKSQHYQLNILSLLEDTRQVAGLGNFAPDEPVTWLRKQTLEKFLLDPWVSNKLKQVFTGEKKLPGPVLSSLRFYADFNKKAMDHIQSVCKQSSPSNAPPIFSFTHFVLPHTPYVFSENGTISLATTPPESDMRGYLEQIKYANTLIRQITECLLKDSSRKKVIIFQGDHGYRDYSRSYQKDEYEALSAIYFYNRNYASLTKDLSHVNTFRVVLNNVFHDSLPLLKDSIVLWNRKSLAR
jgi:hypothetical protein